MKHALVGLLFLVAAAIAGLQGVWWLSILQLVIAFIFVGLAVLESGDGK